MILKVFEEKQTLKKNKKRKKSKAGGCRSHFFFFFLRNPKVKPRSPAFESENQRDSSEGFRPVDQQQVCPFLHQTHQW